MFLLKLYKQFFNSDKDLDNAKDDKDNAKDLEASLQANTIENTIVNIVVNTLQDTIEKNIKELQENGYTIIHNVYNKDEISEYKAEFFKWYKHVEHLHSIIHSNGICKYFDVGHQRFAWLARTNPKIINIFKKLWNTDELVTSFDGCCYYSPDFIGEPHYWIHTDQSSQKKGLHCYQSFLSMTNNSDRTLVLYKGSHLQHQDYFKTMNIDSESDWNILDENYVNNLKNEKIYVHAKEGDLVIWDSRTFHQNSCGTSCCEEERLVQYLCYLPKHHENNNLKEQLQRRIFFEDKRTTSHYPYPMNAVPLQPNNYNYYHPNDKILIDYNLLPHVNLDDLQEEIENLLV